MSDSDIAVTADDRDLASKVLDGVPRGWGAFVVLVKPDEGGMTILAGSKTIPRKLAVEILRGLLTNLENGGDL